jgi:hypothetical protein
MGGARRRGSPRMDIVFHPDAEKRFNELGAKLRASVRVLKRTPVEQHTFCAPYPAAAIKSEDVIGAVAMTDRICDELGNEVGWAWKQQDKYVGLIGEAYQELKTLAKGLEKTSSLRGRVHVQFLVDEIGSWLQAPVSECAEPLITHLSKRCQTAILEHEIWVPLFRVHSSQEFSIGDVRFRTISTPMMEQFFAARANQPLPEVARQRLDRLRSQLQGNIAACFTVTAEKTAAQAKARAMAYDAIALLRFLSPVNWTIGTQSYCLPLGRERIEKPMELFVDNDEVTMISEAALKSGAAFWEIDRELQRCPGLLELLHSLASNHSGDFRRQLYDAMLLYSRNSTASEVADRLVFVLVSIESMLLKDSNEPITKNIGERMAFLIGKSLEERKAIIQNVDATYAIRSKFIHHGNSVEDSDTIERFFDHSWQCFHLMLNLIDTYATKAALLEALENRKLS